MQESKAVSAPVAPQPKPPISKMDIKVLKESIASVAALDPTKLTPAQFAESLERCENLHREVAKFGAQDVSNSWDATKLHGSLTKLENSLAEAAEAPKRELARVQEAHIKTLQVTKAVSEFAIKARKKLSEALQSVAKSKTLSEEVAKRGRGWKQLAEQRGTELEKVTKQYAVACEALDVFAARYKQDTTTLGKRVIELEFPAKAAEPVIAEALNAAKHPKDISAIRESIEAASKSAEVPVPAPAATGTPAPVVEGTPAPAAAPVVAKEGEGTPEPAAPITESATVTVLNTKRGPVTSVTESAALARRLSAGASAN